MTAQQRLHVACYCSVISLIMPVRPALRTSANNVFQAMSALYHATPRALDRSVNAVRTGWDKESLTAVEILAAALAMVEPIVADYTDYAPTSRMARIWTELRDALADEYDAHDPEWLDKQAADNGVRVAEMMG